MSNPIWDESEHHIPIEILALHADGDLSPEEELRTAEHCKVCWLCRTRSEEIERGIRAFFEYRRDVLLPGLPSRKATRSEFQRLVRERLPNLSATSVDPPARSLHRFAAALPRPVRLAGAISVVLVVVLLLFPIAHRSRLTAAEFVSRVRQSEGSTQPGARKFLYQKVRIRRGNQVVIRECYKGLRSMTIDMPHQPQWAATLGGP